MDFSAMLPKTKDKVEALLKQPNSDKLKDSDPLLILAFLNRFHDLEKKIGHNAFKNLRDIMMDPAVPSFDAITRARRRLQAEGLYVGTERATKERKAQSQKVFENLRREA